MPRRVLLPCPCGETHTAADPGRNAHFSCKKQGTTLVYECAEGDTFRLRGENKDYLLEQERIELGRLGSKGISINEPGLSRAHCCFHMIDDGYRIEDLGSRNGTFLNGKKIPPHQQMPLKGRPVTRGQTLSPLYRA